MWSRCSWAAPAGAFLTTGENRKLWCPERESTSRASPNRPFPGGLCAILVPDPLGPGLHGVISLNTVSKPRGRCPTWRLRGQVELFRGADAEPHLSNTVFSRIYPRAPLLAKRSTSPVQVRMG